MGKAFQSAAHTAYSRHLRKLEIQFHRAENNSHRFDRWRVGNLSLFFLFSLKKASNVQVELLLRIVLHDFARPYPKFC